MKRESGSKVKVGDRICIVNPVDTYGQYEAGDEGLVVKVKYRLDDFIGVDVKFDHHEGVDSMFVCPEEFEVIDALSGVKPLAQANEEMGTAESLRNSILDIRSKREALQKEILQLDEQEKEAVEKLKEQGFVLYEDNVSKEPVATERKAVLYAEDIEDDMTNPKNWRVGDLIQCVSTDYMIDMTKGKNYEINGIDGGMPFIN